ncbi:MAG: hypothetical protein MJZ67_04400 [Bacteroidales bacterium]|nr:hypothetical protein [Bacteroidales bacterium]
MTESFTHKASLAAQWGPIGLRSSFDGSSLPLRCRFVAASLPLRCSFVAPSLPLRWFFAHPSLTLRSASLGFAERVSGAKDEPCGIDQSAFPHRSSTLGALQHPASSNRHPMFGDACLFDFWAVRIPCRKAVGVMLSGRRGKDCV